MGGELDAYLHSVAHDSKDFPKDIITFLDEAEVKSSGAKGRILEAAICALETLEAEFIAEEPKRERAFREREKESKQRSREINELLAHSYDLLGEPDKAAEYRKKIDEEKKKKSKGKEYYGPN